MRILDETWADFDSWSIHLSICLDEDEEAYRVIWGKKPCFFVNNINGFKRFAFEGCAKKEDGEEMVPVLFLRYSFGMPKEAIEARVKAEKRMIRAAWKRWENLEAIKFDFKD